MKNDVKICPFCKLAGSSYFCADNKGVPLSNELASSNKRMAQAPPYEWAVCLRV